MPPRESRRDRLACVGAGACLLLALFSNASQASVRHVADERPTVVPAPASGVSLHSMPKALDDMPCAQCYMAPGLPVHGFGGQDGMPQMAGHGRSTRHRIPTRRCSQTPEAGDRDCPCASRFAGGSFDQRRRS